MPLSERFDLKTQNGMKRNGLVRSLVHRRPILYEIKQSRVNRRPVRYATNPI